MKITDLIKESTINLNLQSNTKDDVLEELINQLDQAGNLNDKEKFTADILTREAQSTTGIGEAIAIPHAKSSAVTTPAIVFGRSEKGIDFDSLDGQPAHLFFMIAASDGANNEHLEALSRLSTFLMDGKFQEKMYNATSKQAVLQAISQKEEEVDDVDSSAPTSSAKILAVTACPTGIAHTYMAATKL